MPETQTQQRVEAVRQFNRFYTKQIGLLRASLYRSEFSLTEARILFELAHRSGPTATELGTDLGIDGGYLSRTLRSFEKRGLIEKLQCDKDGRQRVLRLLDGGKRAFTELNTGAQDEVATMLDTLSEEDQTRLVRAMSVIEDLLGSSSQERSHYILRAHQPGDIGWVTHRHGILYSEEYGWDETFEALVAGVLSEFIKGYDSRKERSWIAEVDGEIVGSVFVARGSDTVAKLRLLLVEPKARGMGIGSRLVDECIRFARRVGYQKLELWTNDVLHAARRIYERAGFELVREEKHSSFGHDLVGQWWEIQLNRQ